MKRYVFIFFMLSILFFRVNNTVSADKIIKPGDIVFAEWVVNGWYHGTVGSVCGEEMYTILFDDGDTKCCGKDQIVHDRIPNKNTITMGTTVLAQWTDGKFYPGTIVKIENDYYYINFDDGDKSTVTLSQLRLR
jgi:hypothetical protein